MPTEQDPWKKVAYPLYSEIIFRNKTGFYIENLLEISVSYDVLNFILRMSWAKT